MCCPFFVVFLQEGSVARPLCSARSLFVRSCPPGVEKGCAMSFSTEFSTGFSTGRFGSSGKYGVTYILLIIN